MDHRPHHTGIVEATIVGLWLMEEFVSVRASRKGKRVLSSRGRRFLSDLLMSALLRESILQLSQGPLNWLLMLVSTPGPLSHRADEDAFFPPPDEPFDDISIPRRLFLLLCLAFTFQGLAALAHVLFGAAAALWSTVGSLFLRLFGVSFLVHLAALFSTIRINRTSLDKSRFLTTVALVYLTQEAIGDGYAVMKSHERRTSPSAHFRVLGCILHATVHLLAATHLFITPAPEQSTLVFQLGMAVYLSALAKLFALSPSVSITV